MLKQTRGDPENLLGRAMVYCFSRKEEIYPTLITAADDAGLLGMMECLGNVPEELRDTLREGYRKSVAESRKMSEDAVKRIESIEALFEHLARAAGAESTPTLAKLSEDMKEYMKRPQIEIKIPYIFPSPPDEIEGEFDIIRTHDSPMFIYANNHLLVPASQLYISTFYLQQEGKIKAAGKYVSNYKNIREMEKDEATKTFTDLMIKFVRGIEIGADLETVFGDLRHFARGSSLIQDVANLCGISTTQEPNKIKLIQLYGEKILAVIGEDFERAAELKRQIEGL